MRRLNVIFFVHIIRSENLRQSSKHVYPFGNNKRAGCQHSALLALPAWVFPTPPATLHTGLFQKSGKADAKQKEIKGCRSLGWPAYAISAEI